MSQSTCGQGIDPTLAALGPTATAALRGTDYWLERERRERERERERERGERGGREW